MRSEDQLSKSIIWEAIIENEIATEQELQLITDINGYSVETLNGVIYARTGYRCIQQYLENEYNSFIEEEEYYDK